MSKPNQADHHTELDLSSENTNFIDMKRCFKLCVKDMTKKYLDEMEDMCSSSKIIKNKI